MSESGVYLCPSCQEVIRAEGRKREELVCEACGFELGQKKALPDSSFVRKNTRQAGAGAVVRNVVRGGTTLPERGETPVIKAKLPEIKVAEPEEEEKPSSDEKEVILPDGTRQVRRRKKRKKEKNKVLYIFLGGWILVVIAIVAFFRAPTADNPDVDAGNDFSADEALRKTRHRLFEKKHRLAASEAFNKFMASGVESGKLQYIDRSSKLASKFGRFYDHEVPLVFPNGLSIESLRVIEFAEGKETPGIEMTWTTREGHNVEVLSLWDGKAWKVDWEQLVRYSSASWPLFKLGVDKKEGEFRLFVRRKSLDNDENIEVVFYAPSRPGKREQENIYDRGSPDVLIPARSELGIEFIRLWDDYENEQKTEVALYNSVFTKGDPRGMMRITVMLGWDKDEKGNPVMNLRKIIRPSWYGERVQEFYEKHTKKPIVQDEASFLKSVSDQVKEDPKEENDE